MSYVLRWNRLRDAPQVVANADRLKERPTDVSTMQQVDVLIRLTPFCSTVLEAHQGENRQHDFNATMEKRKLKVLRAAYQKNPEEFHDEPAELLSDMDIEEEKMVHVSFLQCCFAHYVIVVLASLCTYKGN
jgi:hypothetical protein